MPLSPSKPDDDASVFRAIYEANARLVWRVLGRLGVPERDLPDAVQDVFLVVHRKLPEFEPRAKLGTWIAGICRRVAADRRQLAHARREHPASEPENLTGEWGEGTFCTDADALVDQRRARALLESILEQMPETQRDVFALFELDGLSGDEIAAILDLPVGTVRSRLRLAREHFERSIAQVRARVAHREAGEHAPLLRPRQA
jgi:RNA polymerase sigma-70 factor, ECF subfamily